MNLDLLYSRQMEYTSLSHRVPQKRVLKQAVLLVLVPDRLDFVLVWFVFSSKHS